MAENKDLKICLFDLDIYDARGNLVSATDILPSENNKFTLVIFLRNFAQLKVQAMKPLTDVFSTSGTRIVFIGSSTPEQMSEYLQGANAVPFFGDFYTDPSVKLYKTFNLKSGVFRSLFRPLLTGLKTYGMKGIVEGIRLGLETSHLAGDSWQQGGTALLDTSSNLLFLHQENHPADFPNIEDVLNLVGVKEHKVDYQQALKEWLQMREQSRAAQK